MCLPVLDADSMESASTRIPFRPFHAALVGIFGGRRRRLVVFPALLLVSLTLSATARAAPQLALEMTHENPYGAEGTVDPYTGSATTFARESGFDSYTLTVKNTAPQPSAARHVGQTLSCDPGNWYEGEAFTYRWLRNGTEIAGAEGDEYQIVAADEGAALQCLVTDTNAGGALTLPSAAVSVAPVPATAPPVLAARPEVAEYEGGYVEAGFVLTCAPGKWEGDPAFAYRWLRNGVTIAGAESDEYEVTAADESADLQCQVTATNAGGSVVAATTYPIVVEPEIAYPPYTASPPTIPAGGERNETTGQVTVTDNLPPGIELAGENAGVEASGSGWNCTISAGNGAATCTRSDPLAPAATYPPITLHVHVNDGATLGMPPSGGLTNTASVEGGGAPSASVSDPTAITTAVPFGIESFTTSVTGSLGEPFTQAGGHPFAASTTIVFDSTTNDHGQLQNAGGDPREVQVELPPGFVGDPQAAARCPLGAFQKATGISTSACPTDTEVGFVQIAILGTPKAGPGYGPDSYSPIYDLQPAPGHPAELGFISSTQAFVLDASVRSDGDYGITVGDNGTPDSPTALALRLTLCENGVAQSGLVFSCGLAGTGSTPFLTLPVDCAAPAPLSTLRVDSYEDPAEYLTRTVPTGTKLVGEEPNAESLLTGCGALSFQPTLELHPSPVAEGGTTQADEPSDYEVDVKVPQPEEDATDATPELEDAVVTLPEGVTVDPSAADGLQACSNARFGLGSTAEPPEPAACPLASQIGTVKVVTPLLEKPLEGQVFVGEPECSPCDSADAEAGRVFRLFLQVRSPERGVIVKLAGHVSANPATGRLQATFTQQPQLPFSELLLTFTGGARAPLANPQTCGTFTTTTDLTPWSAPGMGGLSGDEAISGTPDATPSSSFDVDWNGAGGACPASLPFAPSFSAGSQTPTAGASSQFAVTFGREDREQDISGVTVTTPPGLLGKIAGVPQCPEAQANAGTCGPESQIGTTTVGAGPGPHPFYLGGRVYLTGPYKGDPFGLSIVVPAVAGPFDLGTVVVRAAITVNPATAALTIASDPLPQYVDGVQLRLREIHVEVNRPGFVLDPTDCAEQSVGATLTAAQGASATLSTPYEVGGCGDLPFAPELTATVAGHGSKADGTSFDVDLRSPGLGQANIAKLDLELPKALSSRDSTLNKACFQAVFAANPAACQQASAIGQATIHTPLLNSPLSGPAYLVSHGGAAFPDVALVLQGEGIELVLDGKTDIKHGITYSSFESAPDAPFTSFEAQLPAGPHGIFTPNVPSEDRFSLCGKASLSMPTILTAQNGKQIRQTTKVTVTGCKASKPLTRAQRLERALHACRAKHKSKRRERLACEERARRQYGPKAKGRTSKKRSTKRARKR